MGKFYDSQTTGKLYEPAARTPEEQPSIARRAAGFAGDVLAGGIEPMMAMASGALATPIAGLAGMASPLFGADPADTARLLQRSMTYPPQFEAGKLGMQLAELPMRIPAAIGSAIGEGLAGVSTRAGMPAPVAGIGGAIGELAGQAVPATLGLRVPKVNGPSQWSVGGAPKPGKTIIPEINPLGNMLPTSTPPKPLTEQQNLRLPIALEARNAGFVFIPTTVQKSAIGSAVETIGKKLSREGKISEKNQKVRNELVAKELGLAKGTPLTVDAVNGVIDRELDAYRELGKAQMPPVQVTTPPAFTTPWNTIPTTAMRKGGVQVDVKKYGPVIDDLAESAGGLKSRLGPGVEGQNAAHFKTRGDAFLVEHEPQNLLRAIIQLRDEAKTNLAGTPDIPRKRNGEWAYKMSRVLENMYEDALAQTGRPDLLAKYQRSRQTIAKAHDVLQSLDGAGNVQASRLVALENQARKKGDKHFTGNLKIAADFAAAFPDANKPLKGGALQHSLNPYDFGIALAEGASGGVPGVLLATAQLGGRAFGPSLAATEWFQKRYANPLPKTGTSYRNIYARSIPTGMVGERLGNPPTPGPNQDRDIMDYVFDLIK